MDDHDYINIQHLFGFEFVSTNCSVHSRKCNPCELTYTTRCIIADMHALQNCIYVQLHDCMMICATVRCIISSLHAAMNLAARGLESVSVVSEVFYPCFVDRGLLKYVGKDMLIISYGEGGARVD